jgi:hypothetical protein
VSGFVNTFLQKIRIKNQIKKGAPQPSRGRAAGVSGKSCGNPSKIEISPGVMPETRIDHTAEDAGGCMAFLPYILYNRGKERGRHMPTELEKR